MRNENESCLLDEKNKKMLVMSTLLLAIILLGIGTIAYFRRTVNGNVTGQAGNLVLIVNEADAVQNETFSVTLQRSEEENFIMPDDKGSFDLNIDSTGSTTDVVVNVVISRTNLPENLKFYLDSDCTQELTTYGTVIKKADTMTKTVPIYWFWDGSISDEADSDFINKEISAYVSVSATIGKTLYNTLMSFEKTVDTDVDFSQGASETNGQGLMIMSSTQSNEYPIMYYRGNVANNSIVYAGYCWLIVRTTETGGTKLIYNGEVSSDGSCTNYSGVGGEEADQNYKNGYIVNIAYNGNDASPVYVGYMYNDTDRFYSNNTFNSAGYITHLYDNSIDSETGRHVQNLKDSRIKQTLDWWYEDNIKGNPIENLVEDTVWCNDRNITSETYSVENYSTNGEVFYFAPLTRLNETSTVTPTLTCLRDIDKFTVNSENGNGDLTYPIGTLTADEINLAGHPYSTSSTTYLTLMPGAYWYTLSPSGLYYGGSRIFGIAAGNLRIDSVYGSSGPGVRPSVSLDNKTYIISGNGSFEQPYRVG